MGSELWNGSKSSTKLFDLRNNFTAKMLKVGEIDCDDFVEQSQLHSMETGLPTFSNPKPSKCLALAVAKWVTPW